MPPDSRNSIAPDMTPDYKGRIPMVCESGLSLTKASMTRFIMHVLMNDIKLHDLHPMNRHYHGSHVGASVRIRPDQIAAFEAETGGKLREPATICLN